MATADVNAAKVVAACNARLAAIQAATAPGAFPDPLTTTLVKQVHDLAQAVVTSGGTTVNLAMADFQLIAANFS